MQRVAFLLRLKEGAGPAYDEAHKAVWAEMLDLLKREGISEYSIFRRDELLVLTMRVEDFGATWSKIDNDPETCGGRRRCRHFLRRLKVCVPASAFQ
jgi:L-rhamnose mutarotase